jgi:hypothetical protein
MRRDGAARVAASLWVALLILAAPASAQIYTRLGPNGVIEATNVPDDSDFRLTYPGKGTLIHSRGFRRGCGGQFDAHIAAAASVYGVSADLVRAVIQVESEFDHLAVSSKGAQGLMQLMPFTARRFAVSDPFDPRQNIFGGVQFLRLLLDLFNGDVTLALAGYNAGENAVQRWRGVPPYKETRGYVQKVRALLAGGPVYAGGHGAPSSPPIGFAPSATALPARAAPRKPVTPARPRAYYKWSDANGTLHVAEAPPPDGVVYTSIRALD